MDCIREDCDGETRVHRTRTAADGRSVTRRRECKTCGTRYTTKERPEGNEQPTGEMEDP